MGIRAGVRPTLRLRETWRLHAGAAAAGLQLLGSFCDRSTGSRWSLGGGVHSLYAPPPCLPSFLPFFFFFPSPFILSMSLSLFSPSSYSLLPFHLPHSLLPRLSGAYIASPCNCDIILEEYNRIVCSGSQCHTSRSAQHYTPVITSYPPTPTVGAPPTRKLNHYTYITDAYVSLSYFPSILVPRLQKNAQSCTYSV